MSEFDHLVSRIKQLKNLAETSFPAVQRDVDQIIEDEITSTKIIERLLDDLMSYMHWGLGEQDFNKLNQYYSKINRENSGYYSQFFKEMFGDE